jgi:peptide/nickel transport system ATP-binding protein
MTLSTDTPPPVIELVGVTKRFVKRNDVTLRIANLIGARIREEVVFAVNEVDLTVMPREVVGLVGESGCGKSTVGRMIAGLLPPSDGTIFFHGRELTTLTSADAREASLKVQMVFQNPLASLNPRLRVSEIIGEAPRVHGIVDRLKIEDYVDKLMLQVGIDPALKSRYPHQFSGGQRQRIGIARALAVKPDFLVCDEAVAALDVSISAQILNLFMDLKNDLGLTYLFISHDLAVIRHLADRIAVMYLGRIIECAPCGELFSRPNHPYTQALLAEMPKLEVVKRSYAPIRGEVPSPLVPPPGCHFHPRCPHAMPRCAREQPTLKNISPSHLSACHLNVV